MSLSLHRDVHAKALGAAVVGMAAFALCDTLHELGHVAAARPLGVSILSISSVGISTASRSPLLALAGPLANLVLSGTLLLARPAGLSSNGRYFAWLFGTVNLFNFSAYLLYSALLGSGDWATVFDSLAPAILWRPAAGLAGVALYAAAVLGSLGVLRTLIAPSVLSHADAKRYCLSAYWAGGLLLTAAAVFNPISPWLILTSGVATGFGAMVGLVFISALLKNVRVAAEPAGAQSVRFGLAWVLVSALISLAFVGVLGRGWQFAPDTAHAAR